MRAPAIAWTQNGQKLACTDFDSIKFIIFKFQLN